MKYKDYYATLGVPRDADAEQIKKAYRKLARQHHPDVSKTAGTEAKFKEIGEAYATLKDPEKRAAYDELGRRPAGQEFAPPPQWTHEYGSDAQSFEDVDLADLLDALGRRHRGAARGPMPMHGRDFETTVRISLEDAYRGTTLGLNLEDETGGRALEVTIPPGVSEGQKLRLRGKGGKGRNGGADGDIYLHITLAPHPVFRPDKHDLHFDLALAPWEAALGAEVEVPTLDGPVVLTVPAGTRAGRKLRLRGRGLANGRGGRGDLYAAVGIDVPATLTERERELFKELAGASRFNPRAAAAKEQAT
ncbi:MAG TPA: DnaJ C-terminal domain-containing protein [Ramlibacter sp.]|nr:DnaJ C-terminal domain-containing protein [Ramlibacter sp.]